MNLMWNKARMTKDEGYISCEVPIELASAPQIPGYAVRAAAVVSNYNGEPRVCYTDERGKTHTIRDLLSHEEIERMKGMVTSL